ncbi:hypothetical protein GCM10008967_30710 [Bacillus carboniphilus]|uniref:Polymer-forming cytoskeletal protein n=1 Tax=Bacillus carboniphilus TaxID=86663 RepID=A0ABN0WHZ5_9BACI
MFKGKNVKIIDTIIGVGTIIEGNVKHETSIRVDGKIYGEVDCAGDIYIGKEGYIESTIKGKNIIVAGEINGNICTTGKIHIQPDGKVTGNVTTQGLIIEDGGIFNGQSTIEQAQSKTKTKNTPKKEAVGQ